MPAIRPVAAAAILLIFPGLARAQDAASASAPAHAPAQEPAPAPVVAGADSEQLAKNVIFAAIVKLHVKERIAAQIEQVVDMLNQKFELKGSYYKDTGNRVRLQLNLMGAGDKTSTMLQVSDGKILWEYQQVLGMKSYRKRDITQIYKKLDESGLDDDFKNLIINSLGFGGPEALLGGFQGTIGFDQFADRDVDGVPSYVLGGKWKNRDGLFGPNDRPLPPTAPLPPYIPSNIQIFLNKETLWPYRIELIGSPPSMIEEDVREVDKNTGRPIGPRKPQPKVDISRITLRYTSLPETEIKPDEQFVFTPPREATNQIEDLTDKFLGELDRAITFKQNEKKAKEAAGEAAAGEIKAPALELPAQAPAPIGSPAPESTTPR